MGDKMKTKRLNVRMSDRRYYKLQLYAATADKTITQLLEDWIDSLPNREPMQDKSSEL